MSESATPAPESDEYRGREGVLKWDDYCMAIAFLSAQRSKDPSTQVGACIAYEDKRIVSTGYNDMPNNCDNLPWGKGDPDKLNNKYVYVCHAELNAVLNKNSTDVKNCTIYVSLFPCNECAKVIIQSGIKKVMYYADKYQDSPKVKASKIMLEEAGVRFIQHEPNLDKIVNALSETKEMYVKSRVDTPTTSERKLDD
ncbi:deoxycytidylate deaminase-like [Mya arenaria]|uniref:deoxycytidylate deaminase-like n=1 Tax=Mya arenaria TaxID=6604 RepID=UPI0022E47923|nr:deoxycytidylate deaminase-like [Mya arenaria]